ncbi:hypothetical protein VCHA53O466_140051 [Vibrio chagasii]|nr:hypothetical protein VCHA53O466_140051 [Vibrio chagasii]
MMRQHSFAVIAIIFAVSFSGGTETNVFNKHAEYQKIKKQAERKCNRKKSTYERNVCIIEHINKLSKIM